MLSSSKNITAIIILLLIKSCIAFNLSGQGIFDYLHYGIKGGANYSYFSNSQPHTSGKTGYSAGFTVEMRRFQRIFIVSGISYHKEGGRYVQIINEGFNYYTNYVASNSISLHNLDIPLLIKVFLRENKQFLPYMFTGPSLVINMAATNDFERTLHLTEGQLTYSGFSFISSEFKQYRANLNLGIGSEVLIANKSILFELAYQYSLTPVSSSFSFINNGNVAYPLYVDGFQLNIAYNF